MSRSSSLKCYTAVTVSSAPGEAIDAALAYFHEKRGVGTAQTHKPPSHVEYKQQQRCIRLVFSCLLSHSGVAAVSELIQGFDNCFLFYAGCPCWHNHETLSSRMCPPVWSRATFSTHILMVSMWRWWGCVEWGVGVHFNWQTSGHNREFTSVTSVPPLQ